MKLKIALEGAINSKTDTQCNGWREWVMAELGTEHFAYHNPMDLDCRGREREMREQLVYFDTQGLGGSHISLVYLPEPSDGTLIGIPLSWSLHRHIVCIAPPQKKRTPWLADRVNVFVETKEEAVTYIRSLLKSAELPATQVERARLMFHLEREKIW